MIKEGFQELIRGLIHGRPWVALCLSVPYGLDRGPIALELARCCLCHQVGKEASPCKVCSKILTRSHPDVTFLSPENASYTMAQARYIKRFSESSAAWGSKKVVILSQAESLGRIVSDTLLKFIEEPIPGRYIFLLAPSAHALTPTLQSRCLRLSLPSSCFSGGIATKTVKLPRPDSGAEVSAFLKHFIANQETKDLAVSTLCAKITEEIATLGPKCGGVAQEWANRVFAIVERLLDREEPVLYAEVGVMELLDIQRDILAWGSKNSSL